MTFSRPKLRFGKKTPQNDVAGAPGARCRGGRWFSPRTAGLLRQSGLDRPIRLRRDGPRFRRHFGYLRLGYEPRFNGALKLAINDGCAFVKDLPSGQPVPPLYFATMKRVNRDGIAATGGVRKLSRLNAAEF